MRILPNGTAIPNLDLFDGVDLRERVQYCCLHPPGFVRANRLSFLPAIQVFAKLFGKVMPFWMGGTLLVHLIVLWLTWHWPAPGSVWLLLATILWIAIILFSLLGPVPINDRVKGWDVNKLPADWEDQRRTWDRLNAIRVAMIFVAFLALLLSFKDLV
jgi:uncharacterized membrane protein